MVGHDCTIHVPKLKNGSEIRMGKEKYSWTIRVDQHFNWFQKKMMKWCFGWDVWDYSDA